MVVNDQRGACRAHVLFQRLFVDVVHVVEQRVRRAHLPVAFLALEVPRLEYAPCELDGERTRRLVGGVGTRRTQWVV